MVFIFSCLFSLLFYRKKNLTFWLRKMDESQDCFKFILEVHNILFINIIRHLFYLVQVVKKWSVAVLLFYGLCIKDFIYIYIFSILTITKRILWMLQTVGLLPTIRNDSPVSGLNKITQTDSIRKKDAGSSPFEYLRTKKLHASSQTSPLCKLKLSFSPQKIKIDEGVTQKFPANELEKSPAILQLEAETPRIEFPSTTYSQTPLCNINLSLTPTVETRTMEIDRISPEERSFLKRIWHSLKLNRQVRKTKTQSIVLENQPNSSGVFTCSENTSSADDHVKMLYEEPDTPTKSGCCSSLATKFKFKLPQERNCPGVSYKRF